jgi:hypothetical protein
MAYLDRLPDLVRVAKVADECESQCVLRCSINEIGVSTDGGL